MLALFTQLSDGWHPSMYLSDSLTPAQRNYDVYNQEILALVTALEEWRHYLIAVPPEQLFEIRTDHQNILYGLTPQNLVRRQAHWKYFLEQFNYRLTYLPGKSNTMADGLSRRSDHGEGAELDNQDLTIFDQSKVDGVQIAQQSVLLDPGREELMKEIKAQTPGSATFGGKQYFKKDGLILMDNWVYVPHGLRMEILNLYHVTPQTGHPGKNKLLSLL